jgi:hypothetical protein
MKADAPAAPPELEVPSWVPESIAQFARATFAADVHRAYAAAIREIDKCDSDEAHALAEDDGVRTAYADVVRENLVDIAKRYRLLVCDHRMRNVWRELSRQRNGTFLHPARAPSSVANMEERQQAAMLELFNAALRCQHYLCWATPTTRGKAEQQRGGYLARANELERDAGTMLTQHLSAERSLLGSELTDKKRCELWQRLKDAAEAYKEYASAIRWAQFFMPEREHDGRARLVTLTIGDKFCALFGSPMYGLTATITSVVLGRRIKPRTARHWCAPHPAVKRQKIVP